MRDASCGGLDPRQRLGRSRPAMRPICRCSSGVGITSLLPEGTTPEVNSSQAGRSSAPLPATALHMPSPLRSVYCRLGDTVVERRKLRHRDSLTSGMSRLFAARTKHIETALAG
jgi:hypothetical protein